VTRHVELLDEDIVSELNKKAESFKLYSLTLDESNDIKDTAQLLIFIRGINDSFEMLILFSNKYFAHFPTLAMQKEATRNVKKYCKSLDDMHREFCRRFSDFEKIDKSL